MNFFTNITFSGESNTFSLKFARNSISFLILNEPLSSSNNLLQALCPQNKVVLYRDTGSVDPGSGPIFGSVSGSEIQILGIAYAKDTFCLY